jgi:hypothetical protein
MTTPSSERNTRARTPEEQRELMSNALVVNRSDSRCGACGEGANPNERTHSRILNWGDKGPGCGAVWTHVTSDYTNMELHVGRDPRWADLIWFEQWPHLEAPARGHDHQDTAA